jgi:protein-disulfide isomerase
MSTVTTETKVTIGILVITLILLVVGITTFKGSINGDPAKDLAQYIQTDLHFDPAKVAPVGRPQVTGTSTTASASSSIIRVTEFMDYECPACASVGEPLVKQMIDTYGKRIIITRRIFPVHGEPAVEVARMVLASQNISPEAYQKLHNKVFETQESWAPLGKAERVAFFRNLTKDLGLNYDTLVAIGKSQYAKQIDEDKAAAVDLGIRATPSFIINNTTRVTGGIGMEYIKDYFEKN